MVCGALMKRLCIMALLLALCFSAFAITYEIVDYQFLIVGKTRSSSLSERVGNVGSTFESVEDLEAFLGERRQDLLNMRLFTDADFTYVMEQRVPDHYDVKVTFLVHDASSLFILPYPKYDSNYGFKLGLKFYDKNVGGNFTNLYAYAGFSQQNNTVRDGDADWEISLSDIKVGKATMTASTYGEMDLMKWERSYASLGASFNNIVIGDLNIGASTNFRFSPKSADKSSPWQFSSVSESMNFAFQNNRFENLSISESFTYYLQSRNANSSLGMSYNMGYDIYSQFQFTSRQTYDPLDVNESDYVEIGIGIKRYLAITHKIGFSNRIMFFINYNYKTEIIAPYFDYTMTSSRSDVNWLGNFRKGYSYQLQLDLLSYPLTEIDRNSFKLWANVCGYIPVTSWLNLSTRATLTLSDRPQPFALSGASSMGDYLRGIRLDNPYVETSSGAEISRRMAFTYSLDLITNFISIRNFCKSYVIPFADMAIINTDADCTEFKVLTTVGGEGVVILDNHPSYPIRGSLGFNAEDLVRFMKGEIGIGDVEFEIYIGMGFFY